MKINKSDSGLVVFYRSAPSQLLPLPPPQLEVKRNAPKMMYCIRLPLSQLTKRMPAQMLRYVLYTNVV